MAHLDISDILDEIRVPSSSSSLSATDLSSTAFIDHQQLTRLWVSERCSPELLPWPTELMQRIMAHVRQQIEKIEDLAAGIGPQTTNGHSSSVTNAASNQNLNLSLSILQTDLSRTQFLVRSLVRQRLAKLTRHATHYLALLSHAESKAPASSSSSSLFSLAEQQFLHSHQALLSGFYSASFLAAFPKGLQRLDDSAGGVNMVEGPDVRAAVFVHCLAERWDSDAVEPDDDVGARAGGVELRMRRGDVWVVRWEDVSAGVKGGSLELL